MVTALFPDATIQDWQAVTAAGSGGYTTSARVTIVRPAGQAAGPIPVTALAWDYDGTSPLPTSGSLTVPAIDFSDPLRPVDWRPSDLRSPLTPFGNRVKLEMAVDDGAGRKVWMHVGTGLLWETVYNRPAETIEVQVADVGQEFVQATTTVDWTLHPLITVGAVFKVCASSAFQISDPAVYDPLGLLGRTVPTDITFSAGTALLEIMQTVVQAVDPAARVFFDRHARLTISHSAVSEVGRAPTGPATGKLSTGNGGHITELRTTLSRDRAVNVVAVAVEDTEVEPPVYTTIRGELSDAARLRLSGAASNMVSNGKPAATNPSAPSAGFTDRNPSPPRWPFADAAAHPIGAVFGQQGSWSNGTHYGTDFSGVNGGKVVSVCQGRIVAAYPSANGPESGWAGKYVVQQASDGSRFMYCHLNSVDVKQGDFLLRAANIGDVGWTGNVRPPGAAGRHLHLERRTSPYRWAANSVDWRKAGDVK